MARGRFCRPLVHLLAAAKNRHPERSEGSPSITQPTTSRLDALLKKYRQQQAAEPVTTTARSESSAQMHSTLTNRSDKINQKPTAKSVGQLNATVPAANSQANQADVAWQLISKGISSKKADSIAEAIVAGLNDQEPTRSQRNLRSNALHSSAVRDTISELMKKKADAVDNAKKRMYDKGNISGLKNGEEATQRNLSNQRLDVLNDLKPQNLVAELASSGVKYNPDEVVAVTKTANGNLLWLERGNTKSGLTHILERHADDFVSQSIDDIPQLLISVINNTPIKTGSNSKGLYADYVFNGNTYRVAYGTNGYIVSFYPID